MISSWVDVVARVRGLSGHLLGRSRLLDIARSRDLVQVAASLDNAYGASSAIVAGSSADQLENAVRRAAARYVRIIALWCGSRVRYLEPVFLDEDRRSVRAFLRGAAAGTSSAERLAGLVPTPALPERALEQLASQATVYEVVALLMSLGHPFGAALLDDAKRPHPDLLRLDLALNSEHARLSARAVRRAPAGDSVRRDLTQLVRDTIDLENASTALQLAAQRSSTAAGQFYISHGKQLDRAAFLRAASAPGAASAVAVLKRAFRGSPLAPVFRSVLHSSFAESVLRAEQRRAMDAARRAPLGVAPIIAFLVRLRAEVRDMQFVIWRTALGAPPAGPDALVTVA
ncbi:MAG: V-type ATPase subunit [Gemmatimonadaceae bacterium]